MRARTRRPRAAWLAPALALVALAATGAAQMAPRNHPLQRRHLMTVRAERTARFLSLWATADEARRAAALRLLDAAGRDAPLGRRPTLSDLSLATRVLAGADADELAADALARFALSLDLQVAPGAFPPTAAGDEDARGTPLTVGCYALDRRTLAALAALDVRELELTLTWLGPGGQRLHARTEPVATSPFLKNGVVLYIRAPRTAPGLWELAPELRWGERRVHGFPVPVECRPGGALDPELREHGLRTGELPPGELAAAPRRLAGAPPRLHGVGTSAGPGARLHLVVLAPEGEPAGMLFRSPLAEAWTALVESVPATLWSVEVGPADRDALADLLRRARVLSPEARLVVVGRGDAAFTLQRLWSADMPAVDGLVLVAPRLRPRAALPSVPTLILGAADGAEESDDVSRLAGSGRSLIDELGLPADLRAWLDRALPDRADAEAAPPARSASRERGR